jgi:transcriptional regulator with XRE-family HTH domain
MIDPENPTIDLSARLRELMDKARLTVADMADKAGVSKSAMEKYLAGPSSPRGTAIAAICREFEVSADWLMFGIDGPDIGSDELLLFHVLQDGIHVLLMELKLGGPLCEKFDQLAPSSLELREFIYTLSQQRAFEIKDRFFKDRKTIAIAVGPFAVPLP